MLKLSGFADLTSCLEEEHPIKGASVSRRLTQRPKPTGKYREVLYRLESQEKPYDLNASEHKALTHKCSQAHCWRKASKRAGMNENRHRSRHAFRDIPKAQYTFKNLLVHGILQFTMLIALRCALHRCSSRDIRR